jgi:hypothetical protein
MTEDPVAAARRTIAPWDRQGGGRGALATPTSTRCCARAPPIAIAAGAVLAREGEPADRAFFLVAGRLRASVALGGGAAERSHGQRDRRGRGHGRVGAVHDGRAAGGDADRRWRTSAALVLRRELFLAGRPNRRWSRWSPHHAGLARRIERTDAQIVEAVAGGSAARRRRPRAACSDCSGGRRERLGL